MTYMNMHVRSDCMGWSNEFWYDLGMKHEWDGWL